MKTFDNLREEIRDEDPLTLIRLELVGKIMASRDRNGYSQRELSRLARVPQKSISRIENGIDVPKISTLIKLAEALDLKLELIDKNKEGVLT